MIGSIFAWFTGSKAGRATAGVIGFALLVMWFYHWAESNGKLRCTAAVQEFSIEEAQRQIDAANKARARADLRAEQAEESNERYVIKLKEYEANADADPNGANLCLTGDDVDSLLDLEDNAQD